MNLKMEKNKIDNQLAEELGITPKMVRFYALRMLTELAKGEQGSREEQTVLYNHSSMKNLNTILKPFSKHEINEMGEVVKSEMVAEGLHDHKVRAGYEWF